MMPVRFQAQLMKQKTIKGKPTIIIAETIKGKGISFMEGSNVWHGKPIDEEHYRLAVNELGGLADE